MNELEKRKVVETYFHNGQSASQIWKLVKYLGISRGTVYRLVKKFQDGGSGDMKLGSGGELSNKNRSAKRKIADRLGRNPAQSVRKIAREIGIPKYTAQDIVRRDLKLRARKKEKKQALTSPQKAKSETRSRTLRRSLDRDSHRRVLFSDEKYFLMDQPLNCQNDRVYIKEGTKKPLNKKTIVEKNKFSRKLMVWAGVAHGLLNTRPAKFPKWNIHRAFQKFSSQICISNESENRIFSICPLYSLRDQLPICILVYFNPILDFCASV